MSLTIEEQLANSAQAINAARRSWAALGLALVAGLMQAASIAAPWNGQPQWWLQMLSMAALVKLLSRTASAAQAALVAWTFTTSWLCGSVWWLYISMHTYGGLAAPLAALAILALCGVLALYYAAAGYVYRRFSPIAGKKYARSAIFFAALWMLAELARDSWFTGFPWGAGGYAHVDGPLSFLAFYVGVYGVGAVAAAVSAAAVLLPWRKLLQGSAKQYAWGALSLVVLSLGIGFLWFQRQCSLDQCHALSAADRPMITSITLLQGNIPQGEKFEPSTGIKESLQWYQSELLQATTAMVVTPETALPLLPRQLPEGYLQQLQQRFSKGQQAALVGIPLGDYERGYTNSALGFKPGADLPQVDGVQAYSYSKHHLVPFGEFIPPLFKWFTQLMNIPLGDFNRGAVAQPSLEWAGQRWAPNICYEDLFGDELARRFVQEKNSPTVMVNMSNIGWFGDTLAIDQHLQISRMRALELGRPMIRATNTGATVVIDHHGRVTHELPRYVKGSLVAFVQGTEGITPFAQWAGCWGLWPLWLLGLLVVVGMARALKADFA